MDRSESPRRQLASRGVSRREFVGFFAGVAAALSLPKSAAAEMASALEKKLKPVVVWLEFQDCTGDTEALLRASKPTTAEIVLDLLSLDYHETLMAAAGHQAEEARAAAVKNGGYICIVEGSIPTGAGGAYCTIGGRSAIDIAREVCGKAAATIAVGTCAAFGGLPAAAPNPTGALGLPDAVPGLKNHINLTACPANGENLTALLVYFLTYGKWPPLDALQRPLFAHGKSIHDNCERRAHFDNGQYVEMWGDAGHRAGYCLYKLGCKGPATFHNCPSVGWNEGTSWPVQCGHGCIGCSEPQFWDRMTPFYTHLAGIPAVDSAANLDKVGIIAVGAVAATFVGHGLVQIGRRKIEAKRIAAEAETASKKSEGGES
jgi:hydrogenase small subunit